VSSRGRDLISGWTCGSSLLPLLLTDDDHELGRGPFGRGLRQNKAQTTTLRHSRWRPQRQRPRFLPDRRPIPHHQTLVDVQVRGGLRHNRRRYVPYLSPQLGQQLNFIGQANRSSSHSGLPTSSTSDLTRRWRNGSRKSHKSMGSRSYMHLSSRTRTTVRK